LVSLALRTHQLVRPRTVNPDVAVAPDQRGPATPAQAVVAWQRTAGNRAVSRLIQRSAAPAVQRDDEAARIAALEASYATNIRTKKWEQAAKDLNGFNDTDITTKVGRLSHDDLVQLDAAGFAAMPGWSDRVTKAIANRDAEADRVGKLEYHWAKDIAGKDWIAASIHLNAFNEHDILDKASKLSAEDLKHLKAEADNTEVGGGRLSKMLALVAGGSHKSTEDEQVGGTVYTAEGGYKYHMTGDSLVVEVGMNFKPNSGVAVPVANWFGYITGTWNHFSAVNDADPADKKSIDFKPVQGPGHDIEVKAGTGRANAGLYWASDTRAPQSVPHEFGHLLGLMDEYERDAADYQKVTDQTAPVVSPAPASAETIARGVHEALFIGEKTLQWHRTAERNRMRAVEAVCAANGIVPNFNAGQTVLTAQVSAAYKRIYSKEMSVDFMARVDTDNDEFNNWREKVLGTFQFTNDSLMGDMSNHTHPVQARHVRAFAGYIQKGLGRGTWTPKEDH
jgi:hypothetical protein